MKKRLLSVTPGMGLDWAGAREGDHGIYVESDSRWVYLVEDDVNNGTRTVKIGIEHAAKLARLINGHVRAQKAIA